MSGESGAGSAFADFVARARGRGELVVQPRMGMDNPWVMREGLLATKNAAATAVGTITLDSYTRMGDNAAARAAVAAGAELNGYPITAHGSATNRAMLDGVVGPDFPVQIRHGSPCPQDIFAALIDAGLDATEGGPVSYCLPYSRMPLEFSVRNWARGCELLAGLRDRGLEPHLETFGGCLLGQLCPPSLLVAMSVLECLFFRQHGIYSVSLSYAQQPNPDQDAEAIGALRRLTAELLPDMTHHIVLYAYMGVYPRTPGGATMLLTEAARLAVRTGAARLIVKTTAEAHQIPSISDNVYALETAAAAAERQSAIEAPGSQALTGLYEEARALIDAVLELAPDMGQALIYAFRRGYLDVPYCLHPDNAGRTRGYLDAAGRLHWACIGSMPIHRVTRPKGPAKLSGDELLASLSYVERKFDHASLGARLVGQAQAPLAVSGRSREDG